VTWLHCPLRAVAIIALLFCTVLSAQPIPKGEIVDKIAAASDPEMAYAVYLPASYAPDRRWPVVFVLDPRRRGALAADLFRDAAAQFGWIIVSSNNTESDSENAPNIRAVQALLTDAPSRFSIDEHRMYLAGFSGTANLAFQVAEKTGAFAGVIGCSGWLPPTWKSHDPGFAWFGTAGNLDFNFLETRSIDDRLAAGGAVHRVEFFAGPHRWAAKDLLGDAVAWMELQAMRRRLRGADPALVTKLLDRDVATANAEADPLLAMRRFESIARSFDGLTDVSAFRARAEDLRRSSGVARALEDERRATALENSHRHRLPSVYNAFLQSEEPLMGAALARALQIAPLQKLAKESSYRGVAAQRVLESIYAQVNFYLPQQVRGPKLVALQTVAAMIHPPR